MLTVAVIQTSIPNQPPLLRDTSYSLLEDADSFDFTVTYTDPEGDAMTFQMAGQPRHGTAEVSQDGLVHYQPDPNYSGPDVIHVVGERRVVFVSSWISTPRQP